jgi:hypothetical protein
MKRVIERDLGRSREIERDRERSKGTRGGIERLSYYELEMNINRRATRGKKEEGPPRCY